MALTIRSEVLPVRTQEDVVQVRQRVRAIATEEGFKLVDQTKIVTAASEIARNTFIYGGGGTARVETVENNGRRGIRVVFEDSGPGIADLDLAMKDGYTTGGGLGLGLSGARRLSNDFELRSQPGEGTLVAITRWK